MEKARAAYGTIPYYGGTYSVTFFKDKHGASSYLTGYGEFPFDEYPDIPVINYKGNDAVFDALKWNRLIEETQIITNYDRGISTNQIISLRHFLEHISDMGVQIYNFKRFDME
jgi:hypothetical protein